MTWIEELNLGPSVQKHYKIIKWKIMHKVAQKRVFLLVLGSKHFKNPEIIPSDALLQKLYPTADMQVIGIAGTKEEAFDILLQLTDEIYRKTQDVDFSSYFQRLEGC